MAQTIGEMMHEVECWQYSKEAYDMQKEAAELGLMAQYIENMQFSMESAELCDTFTEGYLMEAGTMETVASTAVAAEVKADKWWQKALNVMAKIFKLLFSPFIRLYQMIKGINDDNEIVETALTAITSMNPSQQQALASKIDNASDNAAPETKPNEDDTTTKGEPAPARKSQSSQKTDSANVGEIINTPKDCTATVSPKGDVTISKGSKTVVVKKGVIKKILDFLRRGKEHEAVIDDLSKILTDCLDKSGMNKSGAKLHPEQPPQVNKLKIFGFKGSNTPTNEGVSLKVLMYCALTGYQVRLSTQGTKVASIESIIELYNLLCNPNNKKISDFTVIKQKIAEAQQKANTNGIYVKVDDESVNKNTKDLNNIKNELPKMSKKLSSTITESGDIFEESESATNNTNPQKSATPANIENAKSRASGANDMQQALNDLSVMVPNIINISNALVKYKSIAGKAIKNYLAGATGNAGYEMKES